MAKTGLLILSNPARIGGILPSILQYVNKTLYIQWNPGNKSNMPQVPLLFHSQVLNSIYYEASLHCQTLDVRVLLSTIKDPQLKIRTKQQIDILLFDKNYEENELKVLKNCIDNIVKNCPMITLPHVQVDVENKIDVNENKTLKVYNNVVLGGTFDRLHNGHKILLNEALLKTNKRLTVGVTDSNMILTKTLWELIQPCSQRIEKVKNYLEDIDPCTVHDIVPIQDPFGPTKDDPSFQMIVVSDETLAGGKKVNELRASKGLRTLDVHTVPLVKCYHVNEGEEDKISSSNIRMRLLGTRIKDPILKNGLPDKPYVIGLTGGIASGKSSVCKRLNKLGAAVIDCDKLAHDLYRPGESCYQLIVEAFGSSILCENGEINRKILGSIVFNEKEKLETLNSLVWPAIKVACQEKISDLHNTLHYKVIIIEAAILMKAGWNSMCHEIWTCILPPDEAVKRLCERNQLTEDDARSRLAAQPSNNEHVKDANIVFCTLWSQNFTQTQVERAWKLLEPIIKD